MSNADILRAIRGLNDRFSKFEEMVNKNRDCCHAGMQCKTTDDIVKKMNERATAIQERQEEAERYEYSNEDVRKEVMGVIAQIIPE